MKNTRLKTGRIVALLLAGGILTSCSVEQEFSELSERVEQHRLEKQRLRETEEFAIIEKTIDAYKALESYQSKGKVTSVSWRHTKKFEREIDVSLKLKKPDGYLITWGGKLDNTRMLEPGLKVPSLPRVRTTLSQPGVAWSEGVGRHFVKRGDRVVERLGSTRSALLTVMGDSLGGASNIPGFFLEELAGKGNMFSTVVALELIGNEPINGEDCLVLTGALKSGKLVTFWISTNDSLIRQFARAEKRPPWLKADELPAYESEVLTSEEERLQGQLNPDRLHSFIDGKSVSLPATQLLSYSQETHIEVSSPALEASDLLPPMRAFESRRGGEDLGTSDGASKVMRRTGG